MTAKDREEIRYRILLDLSSRDSPTGDISTDHSVIVLGVYRELIEEGYISGRWLQAQDGRTTESVYGVSISDYGRAYFEEMAKARESKVLLPTMFRCLKFVWEKVWPVLSAIIIAYLIWLLKIKRP